MAVQEHFEGFDTQPDEMSRSAHKRQAQKIRNFADKIANLGDEAFKRINFIDNDIKEAFVIARKLKRTSDERRRQLQYAAKLLRDSDYQSIFDQVDNVNATSKEDPNTMRFEIWREYLILAGVEGINDFCSRILDTDRNKIRNLVKKASDEVKKDAADKVNVRTLFKFIKSEVKRSGINVPDLSAKVKELKNALKQD